MFHYSAAHPRHFCMIAKLKAKRTAEDYRRAFKAIQSRHPLLRTTIADAEDGLGPAFVECRTLCEPSIQPRYTSEGWLELVQGELERDFDDNAPLFRGTILHDEAGAAIILTFHHAVADAISGIAVIEDFMRALSGAAMMALGVPQSMDSDGEHAGIGAASIQNSAGDQQAIPDPSALLDIAKQPLWRSFAGDRVAVEATMLDAALTTQLRDIARRHGTTINSAICIALALAAYQRENRSDYTVLSAVNVRPILGLDREACVLRAVAGTVPIARATIDQFWIAAKSHYEAVRQIRSADRLESLRQMLNMIITPDCDPRLASGLLGTLRYDAVVSNLGDLNIEEKVGDISLDALWGPVGQARLHKERFVGVATIGNVLHLIEARPTYQPQLLDKLVRNLRKVCQP